MSTEMQNTDYTLILLDKPHQEYRDVILDKIEEFNEKITGLSFSTDYRDEGPKILDIFVKNNEGEIVGGIMGYTRWGWLIITKLLVDDEIRGDGYGRELMGYAEVEAKKRGCNHVKVETYSFQAREFYENLGYQVVGEFRDLPPGHTEYLLRKDLTVEEIEG